MRNIQREITLFLLFSFCSLNGKRKYYLNRIEIIFRKSKKEKRFEIKIQKQKSKYNKSNEKL